MRRMRLCIPHSTTAVAAYREYNQHVSPTMNPRTGLDPVAFIEPLPISTIINVVPQGREYIVERLGKYHRTLTSGFWVTIPLLDKIRYNYVVKEQGISIPNQTAITSDNVMVDIDGVLFLRIVDSFKASYNIENPIYNLINLAQTTMRSEIGRMDLDSLFRERASLNKSIVAVLRGEASDWGIECKRYEIRDIKVSEIVRKSMDLQAEAERHKRKVVLESQGEATARVNNAEGLKRAQQLAAEANKYSVMKEAEAQAESVRVKAAATADSLAVVSASLAKNPHSLEAVALRVAESYIETFGQLARETNTVVLGKDVGSPAAFSTEALSIFNTVATAAGKAATTPPPPTGQ